MTLAALQRVFADVGRAGSAPRVDTSSKCMTTPAVRCCSSASDEPFTTCEQQTWIPDPARARSTLGCSKADGQASPCLIGAPHSRVSPVQEVGQPLDRNHVYASAGELLAVDGEVRMHGCNMPSQ
jgi:hypothetical protein